MIESNLFFQANAASLEQWTDPLSTFILQASFDDSETFEFIAYTGQAITLNGLDFPVAIDLSTLKIPPVVQFLFNHQPEYFLGTVEQIYVDDNQLKGRGSVSTSDPKATLVRESARNGVTWQVSVGAPVASRDLEYLDYGQKALVNDRLIDGPAYIARNAILREISFVPLGADPDTYAYLAASLFSSGVSMEFETWVAGLGIDISLLTDSEKALLQIVFDSMNKPTPEVEVEMMKDEERLIAEMTPEEKAKLESEMTDDEKTNLTASLRSRVREKIKTNRALKLQAGFDLIKSLKVSKPRRNNSVPFLRPISTPTPSSTDIIEETRRNFVAEQTRLNGIQQLAARYNNPTRDGTPIALQASAEGWTIEKTELEMLRHSRANVPTGGGQNRDTPYGFRVLAAALCQSGNRLDDKILQASFDSRTLEQAHKDFKGRIGLQEAIFMAASLNGYQGRFRSASFTSPDEHRMILQAAFSTQDLGGILSNTVNKYLLQGYTAIEDAWKKIAATRSVNNFQEVTGYRGVGDFLAKPIGPNGEIQHAEMTEQTYGNKASTYARMYAISREDQINDDLGAFTDVPRQLGRGQALAIARAFWTAFLAASPAFWDAANNNVSTGVLGIAGLSAAETVFMNQTDESGEFIGSTPKYLLVPPALSATAMALFNSTQIVSGLTTAGGIPDNNPHAGKFEPIVSRYLSDTTITGNSAVKYYLLADPNDVPVIEVAYLNGQQTPYVETADVDFNRLGIQMRSYWDWGVRRQDPRGGVQSSGV